MIEWKAWATAGFASLAAAGAANAQLTGTLDDAGVQETADDALARDGFYARVGAGATFVNREEFDLQYNPALVFLVTPPSAVETDPDTGFLVSAALGFDYADGIRTELEYRYATSGVTVDFEGVGEDPDAPLPFADAAVSDEDLTAHFILSNFYFDWTNSSAFTPFIGAGVGGAFVGVGNSDRDAVLAYQARAGVSWALREGFSADLEYVYLRTNEIEFGPRPEEFALDGPFDPAVTNGRYEASSVMVSLRKQF